MSGYCAFRTMDKAELQAISRRGGKASAASRREKRRQIEERKIQEAVNMGLILDGIKTLKRMYREMTEEERELIRRAI